MNAILIDVTRCTGCEQCVQACEEANRLGPELPAARSKPDRLSGKRLCSVAEMPGGSYARISCYHCLRPACVEACLVGALTKTDAGPVTYDADKCIGCRYCMLACPFGIPRYEWEQTRPFVRKCTMCFDRVAEGEKPSCVEACPHDAMRFGDRDALLAEAHRRIRSDPEIYLDHVYGEEEVGGTCVLEQPQLAECATCHPHSSTQSFPQTAEFSASDKLLQPSKLGRGTTTAARDQGTAQRNWGVPEFSERRKRAT